jgi:hypothetical protein
MSARSTIRTLQREAGIALLISIFILLLISVVAIALIVASGTESSLAGNYRSATGVYYAALAGLEEARGRLSTKDANSFANTAPAGFLPPPGTPLQMGYVRYVLNPGPADGNVLTTYPDNEYLTEFTTAPSDKKTTASIWTSSPLNALNVPGPLYKWVRINAVSEQSLNLDTFPYDGTQDPTPVYYDGTHLTDVPNSNPQVLEITALAVLPNGSQKMVQYLVAPTPVNLNFNAGLTLEGNNVQFTVPNSSNFWVKGNDQYSAGSCNPGSGVVTAAGYTNNSDSSQSNILSAIQSGPSPIPDWRGNYTNGVAPTPDVSAVTLSGNLQTVAGLNALVQTITQNADVPPITPGGPLSDSNNFMPSTMSSTNPMTIVVNGDLTINGWHHVGYGLLLVTGVLTFDPDASWDGIILVIGKGKLYSHQSGSGQFNGAVFLAQTVDSSGNPLSSLGSPNFDFTSSSGSNGIYYSSCWIQAAMPNSGYKILSFHEIAQ